MNITKPSKTVLVSTFFLFLLAKPVMACMCPFSGGTVEDEVNGALAGSTAVFIGKVVDHEYKKGVLYERQWVNENGVDKSKELETRVVKFKIERWWKMELPSEILFITDVTREVKPLEELVVSGNIVQLPRGESLNMCHTNFVKDQTYLVYASGDRTKLQYRYCTRTTLLTLAQDDLSVLGAGQKPSTQIKR
jgi:hypothetical protein